MTILRSTVCSLLAGLLIASCNFRPLDEDRAKEQYDFAASCLNAFFIFRDRLPPDLYAFSTPQELYKSVKERWTEFFDPGKAREFSAMLTTTHEEGGIGIRIDSMANGYLVKELFPASPGEKAGLQVFDTIMRVNDIEVAGMERYNFRMLLKGEIGSQVLLRIKRSGDQKNINVTRGTYTSPSVFVDSIDTATALIFLTGFYLETNKPGGSAAEFSKALDSTGWAKNTIIDLRDNPGGYVDQSRSIIGELVPAGTPIVRVHKRQVNEKGDSVFTVDSTYLAKGGAKAADRKLFLLIDNYTASAAEIMVSCLMQREGVTVVGERTFGKGRGQFVIWNPDDSSLCKITCMTLTPADTNAPSYDTIGIDPEVQSVGRDAFDVAMELINGTAVMTKRRLHTGGVRPGACELPVVPRQPAAIMEIWGWHD